MLLLKTGCLFGNFTKIYNTEKGPQQCEPFFIILRKLFKMGSEKIVTFKS